MKNYITAFNSIACPQEHIAGRISQNLLIPPGSTQTICALSGPGEITHIWMTVNGPNQRKTETFPRDLILRIYWDNEEHPSVEAPLHDFFGIGFGMVHYNEYFQTLPFVCNPNGSHSQSPGLNCYFPMPFDSRAIITITNEGEGMISLYRQIDYKKTAECYTPLRFHAKFRREKPAGERPRNFTLLEAQGTGHYVGCFQYLEVLDSDNCWFHGGGDMIYVDGDTTSPSVVHGIGGEDFVLQAWGTSRFTGLLSGCLYQEGYNRFPGSRYALYRFYLDNPIPFRNCIRVSQQVMANDIASVAFWYQEEPHAHWTEILPRNLRLQENQEDNYENYVTVLYQENQIPWEITDYYEPEKKVASKDILMDRFDVGDTGFEQSFPPETKGSEVKWKKVWSHLGFLDFLEYFRRKPFGWGYVLGVAYARTTINSPLEQDAVLLIGFDDDIKIWLNNTPAGIYHQASFGTETIPVKLRKGRNEILIKSSNHGHGNEFWIHCITMAFLNSNNEKIENLRFSLE